jgi:hypothetical protein
MGWDGMGHVVGGIGMGWGGMGYGMGLDAHLLNRLHVCKECFDVLHGRLRYLHSFRTWFLNLER